MNGGIEDLAYLDSVCSAYRTAALVDGAGSSEQREIARYAYIDSLKGLVSQRDLVFLDLLWQDVYDALSKTKTL